MSESTLRLIYLSTQVDLERIWDMGVGMGGSVDPTLTQNFIFGKWEVLDKFGISYLP